MKIIPQYLFTIIVAGSLCACTRDFTSMNVNPNSPEDVPSGALLGPVLVQTATINNNFLGGLYSQQYAQNTYVLEDLYSTTTSEQNGIWNNSYSVIIKNANIIRTKAIAENDPTMQGVAEVVMAQAFHTLTDIFGDIPYTEANKIDEGLTTPTYDKQQDVYLSLLNLLKSANSLLDPAATVSNDLLFGGSAMGWKKYANSLRLRIALRMSAAAPAEASQVITEMLADPGTYPLIDDNAENAVLQWQGSSPYYEPWYNVYRAGNDNYAASKAMVDELLALNDPRLPYYVTKAVATNTYVGAVNGPFTADIPNRNSVSRIGSFFTANPGGKTKLLVAAETWLSIAEAAESGLVSGISAADAYRDGIRASMEYVGIDVNDAAVSDYLNQPSVRLESGNQAGNLTKIRLQKWLALYLQGFQAWAEVRRTDVPQLTPAPATRFPGMHNRPPFRLQYPSVEQDLNKTNYLQAKEAAGITEEKDLFWGKQMWWDKRPGVF